MELAGGVMLLLGWKTWLAPLVYHRPAGATLNSAALASVPWP